MVLESAKRELLRAVISVTGLHIGTCHAVAQLANIADAYFRNWTINVLGGDHVALVVCDNLSSATSRSSATRWWQSYRFVLGSSHLDTSRKSTHGQLRTVADRASWSANKRGSPALV